MIFSKHINHFNIFTGGDKRGMAAIGLATEPRWGRINGTFGEDANLSAKLTYAYIRGFQGDSLSASSVACMTKHFSGGGPQKEGTPARARGMEKATPEERMLSGIRKKMCLMIQEIHYSRLDMD